MHRLRYLAWMLASALLLILGLLGLSMLAPPHGCGEGTREQIAHLLASVLYVIVIGAIGRAVALRLHDLGLSGLWGLLPVLPLLLLWAAKIIFSNLPPLVMELSQYAVLALPVGLLLLLLARGQADGNVFGAAPLPPGAGGRIGVFLLFIALLGSSVLVAAPGNYAHRAAAYAAYLLVREAKQQVAEYWKVHRRLPGPGDIAIAPLPEGEGRSHVRSLRVAAGGVVTLEFSGTGRMPPACAGRTLILRPVIDGDQFSWDCTGGTLPTPLRPRECRPRP